MTTLPLLSLLILVPLAGAAIIWFWPRPEHARPTAFAAMIGTLLLTIPVLARFDRRTADFQFVERHDWIPSLGIQYLVGIDGISTLFLPAVSLISLYVTLASWNTVHTLPRLYYSLLLVLTSATFGVFCALDTILFYLFWELTLVPLYFLVSLWGIGPNRRHAATKYVLVMMAGGAAMLFGFLLLAFANEKPVFDLPTLLATPMPTDSQYLVFFLLLIGFGVKVPLFPFHTWLPLITMEGPAPIAALLTGLKLGAYGLVRFALPLAPTAAQDLNWLLAGLGTLALLFGAVTALSQTNLRRMLGYASLSHVGLVLLGVASFNLAGIQGAILQLLNFTLASGGLFLLTSHLHHRTGSTDMATLGGAARSMPRLAGFFLFFGLVGLGMPGTSGFPAEFLILVATFQTHAGTGIAALLGMVLGGAYFLLAYRKAFLGSVTHPAVASAEDLRPREFWPALCFALILLVCGFWPGLLIEVIRPTAETWVMRIAQ